MPPSLPPGISSGVAVVTGAGSGLGRAIALAFAASGMRVLLVGRRREPLEATARACGPGAAVCPADVAEPTGRAAIVAAMRAGPSVRRLVHGAGIHSVAALAALTPEDFRATLATNVEARFFLTRDLLPWFAPGARVLFLGSNSATRARRGGTAYCVAQAGSFMLHTCLKAELGPRGILVGGAIPSPAHTPMVDALLAAAPDVFPDTLLYRELHAAGRLISPAVVARFICWLLRETTPEEFVAQEWRITDESHHARWLGGAALT